MPILSNIFCSNISRHFPLCLASSTPFFFHGPFSRFPSHPLLYYVILPLLTPRLSNQFYLFPSHSFPRHFISSILTPSLSIPFYVFPFTFLPFILHSIHSYTSPFYSVLAFPSPSFCVPSTPLVLPIPFSPFPLYPTLSRATSFPLILPLPSLLHSIFSLHFPFAFYLSSPVPSHSLLYHFSLSQSFLSLSIASFLSLSRPILSRSALPVFSFFSATFPPRANISYCFAPLQPSLVPS